MTTRVCVGDQDFMQTAETRGEGKTEEDSLKTMSLFWVLALRQTAQSREG